MVISIIRTIILYVIIIISLRIMGKRQISELQTTELVVTLLISDIAAIPMQNTEQSLLSGIAPIVILILFEIISSVIMLKKSKVRAVICGKPQIVINNGKIEQSQLLKLRISTEELCEQLRLEGIFSLEDVQYAIIETNGKMSVMKKPNKDTPTLEQLSIEVEDKGLEAVVISDGEILKESSKICGVDDSWIFEKLKKHNNTLNEVFIMTVNGQKEYNIILKEI